ncbi:MAG: ABC transporter ATP-binding protein [Prevotella sp.]|nr:ABC transporter ATP-binding protein [Prevotella sp.]
MAMLCLENITKRYADGQRALTVLDDLSLQVNEGEFIAITGESGAGKTTLLNILGTLVSPDEGQYLIRGKKCPMTNSGTGRDETERLCQLRNKEIGFVYQDHRLLPQYTVRQNILLPTLAAKSTSMEEEEQHALELLEFMGIAALKDSPVTQLSGGEQTRVAICRALINRPSILLADEPTGQLDAANAQTIAKLFQHVNTQLHTTIIMATHSAEMAKVAQKTYRLIKGKLMND